MKEIETQILAESVQIGDLIKVKTREKEEKVNGVVENIIILNRIMITKEKRQVFHHIYFEIKDEEDETLSTKSYKSKDIISKILKI